MTAASNAPIHWPAERRFYTSMAFLILGAVLLGFARTFFLAPWFPEAAKEAAPEPYFFYIHGVVFTAWILLLIVQPLLVANRRVDLHRKVGWFGAGLAAAVVIVGAVGALIAASRPGGFLGVPIPAAQFLAIPFSDLTLFTVFVVLAITQRRDPQRHKRFMLLATISLLDAAVGRFPFGEIMGASVFVVFNVTDLLVDLFLVPMIVWDVVSRGRVHLVTLVGGLAIIACQPLRFILSQTSAWQSFAAWAIGLAK